MTTNNNSTSGNDTKQNKNWAEMNDDTKPPKAGDDTRKTGDLPTDPQPKSGDDSKKQQGY